MHNLNLITAMVHLAAAAAAKLTKDAEGAREWETSNADDAGGLMLSFVLAVRVEGFNHSPRCLSILVQLCDALLYSRRRHGDGELEQLAVGLGQG